MSMTTREFIGREQEIAFLSQWLAEDGGPSVVYIHDAIKEIEKKGGIGKTWLLNRYYELVDQQHEHIIPVAINFFDILDRNAVVIAARVVREIRKRYPHWQAEDFGKTFQEYQEAMEKHRAEEISSFRERLADALTNDLRLLQQSMLDSNT